MKSWVQVVLLGVLTVLPLSSRAQYIIQHFPAPGPESRGLAWDGQYLWCADAALDSIFKIDPATGQVVYAVSFDVQHTLGGGLTWSEDGALWLTRYQYFRKIDPVTGQELANFHCPGG